MRTLAELQGNVAGPGRVDWIGLRPARRAPMVAVEAVEVTLAGLVGDRHPRPGKRAVTLVQTEHLPVIAALSGREAVTFEMLRRNIGISGLNLAAMRGRELRIGSALVRITGICAPCSRMEETLGHGGYTAVRGHGGMVAEVLESGDIQVQNLVVENIAKP